MRDTQKDMITANELNYIYTIESILLLKENDMQDGIEFEIVHKSLTRLFLGNIFETD